MKFAARRCFPAVAAMLFALPVAAQQDSGASGANGASGAAGANGANGANGASGASGTEDAQVRAAKEKYSFSEWKQGAQRHGLKIHEFAFAGREGDEIRVLPNGLVTRTYRGTDGRSPLRIELRVHGSARQAHQFLVENLAFVSSLKTLPTTASEGATIGDRGYIGHSGATPGAISWIAWVDGNVSVRLCCTDPRRDPQTPMIELAESLSAAIRQGPELPRRSPPTSPTIDRLEASAERCKAGEELELSFSAQDALGSIGHVQWRILGDAQGYIEPDGDRWLLTTTGKGSMRVELTVLGAFGTPATRTIEITVDPEG